MSSNWSQNGRLSLVADMASMRTGARRCAAVEVAEITMAVEPSQGTSQSNKQIGVEIMREARYSSTVSGPR